MAGTDAAGPEGLAGFTLVGRMSSNAPAGIAVVCVEGREAGALLARCWEAQRPDIAMKRNRIRYGVWHGPLALNGVDRDRESARAESIGAQGPATHGEGVVVCQVSEDTWEIHCHGGPLASERIVEHLVELGAKRVEPYQLRHVARGYAGDRLSRAALQRLPSASTLAATRLLLDQARGALTSEVVQALGDWDRGDAGRLKEWVERWLEFGALGSRVIEGWRVAILGPPNVGKSSLLNRILGYSRAIVHAQAGTTRDALRERTAVAGWPVQFVDTAGLRSTADRVESLGIETSLQMASEADIRLILVSPDVGWTPEHERLVEQAESDDLLVLTKADLGCVEVPSEVKLDRVAIRCDADGNCQPVLDWLASRVQPAMYEPGMGAPFLEEQVVVLRRLMAAFAVGKGVSPEVDRLRAWVSDVDV